MESLTVVVAAAGDYLDEAAQVWAEATSARDGDADVPPLHLSRPVIEGVVASSARSLLLVALDAAGQVVGFAAAEPVSGSDDTAELRYLGVRPGVWGGGVATQLLLALRDRLKEAGFREARLGVYVDNVRAAGLYERLGWRPHERPIPHPRSGRPEQQYRLEL